MSGLRTEILREMLSILSVKDYTVSQKLNYARYRLARRSTSLKYNPVFISIVATSRCNLKCRMCPTHSAAIPDSYPYRQSPARDMDFDTFKEAVDRFRDAISVNIIGSGEPLLNRDLFRMAEYASLRRKMKVKTFTNGILLGEKAAEIADSFLDGITVSINGHDAAEFNRLTGMPEASYGDIYRGTQKLIERRNRAGSKLKVKLAFIVDRENYKNIDGMIDVARRLGVDRAHFCNFLPCPYEGFTAGERTLTSDDKYALDAIRGAYGRVEKPLRKKIVFPLILDRNSRGKKCGTHFSQIRIDGEGNVGSCSVMLLNMEGHGNFRDKDVWNNEFFRKMRGKFINDEEETDPPCRECVENHGVYPW